MSAKQVDQDNSKSAFEDWTLFQWLKRLCELPALFNVNQVEDLAMFAQGWWVREWMQNEEGNDGYYELIHGFQAFLNKMHDPNYDPSMPTSWVTLIRLWSGQGDTSSVQVFNYHFKTYQEQKGNPHFFDDYDDSE